MATLLPDFSVRFIQRRWACVLDPFLALSPDGLVLAKHLSRVVELWIFRELWQILDNTEYYLHHPEAQLYSSVQDDSEYPILNDQALQTWEQFRTGSDVNRLNMYWIGDSLGQSLLPDEIKPNIIHQYEALACALDGLSPNPRSRHEPMTAACRDAAALTACLNSALILTYLPQTQATHSERTPPICQVLERWGIPCQKIDSHDPIATIERDYLQHLVVHAGLAKLIWSGLQLAALHLSVPAAISTSWLTEDEDNVAVDPLQSIAADWPPSAISTWPAIDSKLWSGTKGFWHSLTGE